MLGDPECVDISSAATGQAPLRAGFVLCRGGQLDGKRFSLGRSQTLSAGDEIAPLGLPYIYWVTDELVRDEGRLCQVAEFMREYVG